MKRFIISPPFGTFIRHPKCTPVLGTYTLRKRGGLHTKAYRALTTIRPTEGGWINRMGLQNAGIASIESFSPGFIYSVAAIEPKEWDELIAYITADARIELNVSCPNLAHKTRISDKQAVRYLEKFPDAIFKLSPTDDIVVEADRLARLGARFLHVANTLPTPRGGESGAKLRAVSIKAAQAIHFAHPNITIIGGGGIYAREDIEAYRDAGATHFSLATIWMYPPRALRLLRDLP